MVFATAKGVSMILPRLTMLINSNVDKISLAAERGVFAER